jgi:hypothetical protein
MSATTESNAALYARLNARVARGECYWCGTPDSVDWCDVCAVDCPRCGDILTGCAWGPDGVCLACHESALLPVPAGDSWAGEYIGLNYG